MKTYTIDVTATYTQTVEVQAASLDEAYDAALYLFEVNDAQQESLYPTFAACENTPSTQGETK